ncbi:MAG: HAD family hydrolase [Isosphaeraceae bacterium]
MRPDFRTRIGLTAVLLSACAFPVRGSEDPLPSWNDGASRKAILAFVARVTDEASPDFVPAPDRIAAFDNDGTLWCEQPMYVQAVFVRDRIRAMAASHPEWKQQQPFQAVLEGNRQALADLGEKGLVELVTATHAGMTADEFSSLVRDWIATARHPRFDRPYTKCIYQPMLELLAYLRANGFKTYIVTGGGVEFVRAWSGPVYGIPPEQVVGSTVRTRYELRGETPVLMRLPEVDFIDDKAGKPVGIGKFLGKRPIAAFGNSDGDYEMLRYVTAGEGARFGLIVHHTDADREYAYDRESPVGRLVRALDEAPARGWTVVDMKRDWRAIFPPEK